MKQSGIIQEIKQRLNILENPVDKKAKPKKTKVDEDVCSQCGGDLQFVEENIVYCPKCKEYFEYDGEDGE